MAILAVAAVLRLIHISQPFTDYASWREASTAMMADNYFRRNWNIFFPEVSWNGPGESYQGREFQTITYISALLYIFLGQHDWVGRGVAVVFGLWGIFALYQLVRQVWDEEHAIAAAAMMALLPGSIFVDRSFLPDPAMVSLVVTSFWILVTYLNTEKWKYLLLASIIAAWGFLTKITGLIVGIPMLHAIWVISRQKQEQMLLPKRVTAIICASIAILISVISYYLWARYLAQTYPPYHFAGSHNWLWDSGLKSWLEQKYFLNSLYWNYDRYIWTKPLAILVILGFVLKPPQRQPNSHPRDTKNTTVPLPWIFHWWALAGLIYYLVGAKELVINSWNFHILNPAAAAFAGHALLKITSWARRFGQFPAMLAVITTIMLVIGGVGHKQLQKMYFPPEPHWNATEGYLMGMALRKISQPDDLVVTVPNDIGEPVAIYYSLRRGWVFPPPWPGINWTKMSEDEDAVNQFEELRQLGADWFGIVNEHREWLWQNNPKFMKHIENTCEIYQSSSDWIIYRIL
ncbi:ArnT family glycosyltransferase [Nodosilinea sp. E11]|uniref:ArnT family glycosyltransferase n=1 Tax=Nodosilinea sp. E11 TaxID=3037479 RepID=UPI0029343E5B|nr:glycosyltransferase family 39 protein [Nodosilinea sp. E11]WOD39247.1 glycosyltransferase family 39 protein [Nodosilinea sp. E11]